MPFQQIPNELQTKTIQ